jgi:formylglycine-generating enzyme required for sulfatase activity
VPVGVALLQGCSGCPSSPPDAPSTPRPVEAPLTIPADVTELPTPFRCAGDPPPTTCFRQVEGATFRMGAQAADPTAPNHDPHAGPHEGPVHEVTVSTFWMLANEVDSGRYALCVSSAACSEDDLERGPGSTYQADGMLDHPINFVSWTGADRYCRWLGGRLPTEAEWELAARSTDARVFPWGNEPACGTKLADPNRPWTPEMATGPCRHDGTLVPGDLRGDSPYGVTGLAGNVWEWVADGYGPYPSAPQVDPRGPTDAPTRVQRGGGWVDEDPWELRSAARVAMPPDSRMVDVGFRCVWVPPDRR